MNHRIWDLNCSILTTMILCVVVMAENFTIVYVVCYIILFPNDQYYLVCFLLPLCHFSLPCFGTS